MTGSGKTDDDFNHSFLLLGPLEVDECALIGTSGKISLFGLKCY